MINRPVVGVALIVRKNYQILLHKRIGKHAPGTWSCPGGHLEMWEEFAEAALRELKEEAGPVEVTEPVLLTVCNTMFKSEDKHSITIFLVSDWISGEPKVTEPDKCEEWLWFDYDNLPEPLMLGIQKIKEQKLLKVVMTKPYDLLV
jgi:8-oxo-dGTP diphosphatase